MIIFIISFVFSFIRNIKNLSANKFNKWQNQENSWFWKIYDNRKLLMKNIWTIIKDLLIGICIRILHFEFWFITLYKNLLFLLNFG